VLKNNQEKKLTPLMSTDPYPHDLKSGYSTLRPVKLDKKNAKVCYTKYSFFPSLFRKLLRNFHFLERKLFSVGKVSQIGERKNKKTSERKS